MGRCRSDLSPQCAAVFSFLKAAGNASTREIFISCNINSPRKRISELTDAGIDIRSFWDESVDEYGTKHRYKRYFVGESK